MFSKAKQIYLATRKRNDQLFNTYLMRPIAAALVVVLAKTKITPNQITLAGLFIFIISAVLLAILPDQSGAIIAVFILQIAYLLDCADGMLARHKQIASRIGHLFDFFTDELKATLLVAAISIRMWRSGCISPWLTDWPQGDARILLTGVIAVTIIASALSITNFVRRPELSGKVAVEAHYETVNATAPKSLVGWTFHQVMIFLRFINHYPSHIVLWAFLDRFDYFFWVYIGANALYLAKEWMGLTLRLGKA